MSLYDDEDLGAPSTEVAVGWSSGVKLMQSQLQAKKASSKPILNQMGPPRPNVPNYSPSMNKNRTFSTPVLAPVIDLKSKKPINEDSNFTSTPRMSKIDRISTRREPSSSIGIQSFNEPSFVINNEYDPLWPNDYHKVITEMRGDKKKEDDPDAPEAKKRRYTEEGKAKARERFARDDPASSNSAYDTPTGFGRRPQDDYSDDEDDSRKIRRTGSSGSTPVGGAAIAPPPSLTETTSPSTSPPPGTPSSGLGLGEPGPSPGARAVGLGVAAKIMAKYGYKQGQGLGRSEQGMSQALSVEKTSRRGGRIVHEKDLMPPPMFGESFKTPFNISRGEENTPPRIEDTDEYGDPIVNPGSNPQNDENEGNDGKPSITELMKNPSKVVLCQNMVGPGEVDSELEPEIKEECNGKYGDVQSVVIFEIPNAVAEEAVRIFVEFKRVESAIKAVVDLNGRFFGGREVRASFYNVEKFKDLNLTE